MLKLLTSANTVTMERIKIASPGRRSLEKNRDIRRLKSITNSYEVHTFNYSIDDMKAAISAPSEEVPNINSVEDLDNWLDT